METRAYRSKIGRLPHALRTELNERMRDGATGKAVCDWLNGHPDVIRVLAEIRAEPVRDQNITEWRQTGYKDWLHDQEKLSGLRAQAELARDMAAVVGGDPLGIGTRFLAGKLMDCMSTADPQEIAGLAKSVAALRLGETAASRVRLLGDKVGADRERLELDKQRFRFQVAARALDIFADDRAKEIAAGPESRDEKIKRLLEHMERQEREGDKAS
jgi:hypothetical protein